jgi:hypothetical protein
VTHKSFIYNSYTTIFDCPPEQRNALNPGTTCTKMPRFEDGTSPRLREFKSRRGRYQTEKLTFLRDHYSETRSTLHL